MHGALALAGADLVDQLVEGIVVAIVGADDPDLVAPHEHGHRGLDEADQVRREGRLVDHHHALLAAQVRRAAGERDDALARLGEVDAVGLDFLVAVVVEDAFLDLAGGQVEGPRPHGARLDVFQGHVLRGADVEDVGAVIAGGDQHIVCRFAPGEADASTLLGQLERRLVGHPALLVAQKHRRRRVTGRLAVEGGFERVVHVAIPRMLRRISSTEAADRPPLRAMRSAVSAAALTLLLTSAYAPLPYRRDRQRKPPFPAQQRHSDEADQGSGTGP